MDIYLHNTKSRKKELLRPVAPGKVGMYVCGPTVYDRAHIGNARPVIVFDVLYRLLRHVYGAENVRYVRNFTDVDDKIIARAEESGREIGQITEETSRWYLEDMAAVGALEPTDMPRATQFIEEMQAMIQLLIEKEHAYVVRDGSNNPPNEFVIFDRESRLSGHTLFDVDSFEEYGRLSGRSTKDMIAGARVEVAPYKRNPMDFVLWKPAKAGEPGWDSPWGRGRPGWHIECSAMADSLLGKSFDIHGGGNDLMFPHHENEIAQSCCAHPEGEFARIWMHNEMLQVEGKKMSKSLGNFFTVRDLLDQGVPGEVIRFVFLGTHYRKPMDWTEKKRKEAESTLRKWRTLVKGVEPGEPDEVVLKTLTDDLNVPFALTRLHGMARTLSLDPEGRERERENFLASAQLLGLLTSDLAGWEAGPAVDLSSFAEKLAALREEAMETKDFSAVDALKAALIEAGVEVKMSKQGIDLEAKPGFDAAKLEGLA